MNPVAMIVVKPALDQLAFLPLCREMLGYSPARRADGANLKEIPHLMTMLAGFRSEKVAPGVRGATDIYDLLHFGCLIAADERDMLPILEITSGMPFALTETVARGVLAVIVTGSLRQWRRAILRGCRAETTTQTRCAFGHLYTAFSALGLADLFGASKRVAPDHTFLLITDGR
jgi:hypothetical protein